MSGLGLTREGMFFICSVPLPTQIAAAVPIFDIVYRSERGCPDDPQVSGSGVGFPAAIRKRHED
jgi:hypothetical protein